MYVERFVTRALIYVYTENSMFLDSTPIDTRVAAEENLFIFG